MTEEEEKQLNELISKTKMNIREILQTNLQDLKTIRMAAAEIVDDLIYDHSQIPADVDKLNMAIKQFHVSHLLFGPLCYNF
jgi:hypothetical protein